MSGLYDRNVVASYDNCNDSKINKEKTDDFEMILQLIIK